MFQAIASSLAGAALVGLLLVPSTPTAAPAAPAPLAEGEFAVDAVHSSVLFSVMHFGTTRFYGRFNDVSGTVAFDPAEPTASSVSLTIPVESVDTHDAKRDQHLSGPDFFSAKEFPEWTFASKSVRVANEASDDEPLRLAVTGDLTLAGTKKEVTVVIEHTGSGAGMGGRELVGFHTRFTIQRSDYGIDYMLGGLSDEVEVILSLECGR